MSRIVLATWSLLGNLNPLLALELALRGRGREIVLATSGDDRVWIEALD